MRDKTKYYLFITITSSVFVVSYCIYSLLTGDYGKAGRHPPGELIDLVKGGLLEILSRVIITIFLIILVARGLHSYLKIEKDNKE